MAGLAQMVPDWSAQSLALPSSLQGWVHAQALTMAPQQASALPREPMRQAVHQAICQTLAALLGCAAGQLAVQRRPGQAPLLLHAGQPLEALHLSISYADAMAVWACSQRGAVGIDVQGPPGGIHTDVHAAGWPAVAALYLEPGAAAALAGLTGMAWQYGFAQQWAQLEAQLKCAGLALAEAQARPAGWNADMALCELDSVAGPVAIAWRALA